ncbi:MULTISPECIES: Stealth CR1 domain-containing protein [unclassified Streptomyces]|uniref:Stealth CR1 domain-containing protein n=1 Tax=unclassified Streptomyces TaxID=2593676 RepID=UPI0006916CFD|nr:Stealth CR1 domain-containing protein [Streptomyces sp. NRRL F-2747]
MQGLSRLPLPVGLRRIVRTLRRPGGVPRQPDAAQRERTGSGSRVPAPPGRAREDELLGAAADLVRHRGRLSRVRDDLLPAGARDANLSAVAEALETAAVPYGLVPDGELRHRVAIAPGDREAALKACAAAFAGLPVYARLLVDGDGNGGGSGAAGESVEVLAESLPEAVAAHEEAPAGTPHPKVKGILLFQPVVTSGRTVAYGPETGCDLEFWEAAESGIGAIAGLRETPYGWWVPTLEATSTTRVGDRDHPVVDAFAGRFPDDIDFPVDAVITWVDAADPAWRRRRDRAAEAVAGAQTGAGGRAPVDHAENRYRDRGELRYCLRSIAAHAPWIRHVFLVTDDQTPAWLADHPQVTVVDHRELFADPAGLPVFNSHAIESRLHRIPGLAEHFLYFNDDIFLGRPQRPQNYFLSSGLPKVFHDRRAVAPSAPGIDDDDVFTASQKATRHAVEQTVGRTYPHILAHTPYPLSRSLFAHVEERLPGRLTTISRSVFRSADDLAPVTLASHLALADGRAVEGELHHAYVSTGRAEEIARLPGLAADRRSDAFCLADDDTAPGLSPEEQQRAVTAFLEAYFPVPSPYER